MTGLLAAWMELVEYLYDGRMLALVQAGLEMVDARGDRLALLIQDKVEMNVALLASGTAITSRYRLGLMRLLTDRTRTACFCMCLIVIHCLFNSFKIKTIVLDKILILGTHYS